MGILVDGIKKGFMKREVKIYEVSLLIFGILDVEVIGSDSILFVIGSGNILFVIDSGSYIIIN